LFDDDSDERSHIAGAAVVLIDVPLDAINRIGVKLLDVHFGCHLG
jgi:hypothetical protein